MSADARRWRPRRAGIINLYEYADQTFDFAGGRLLLRGHNTSGKTKALELLLPFCLDGDIHPRKLDPFASGSKDMKWNLVGCVDQDQRIGYVWLEFERIDEAGASQRLTAGIGMRGHRALPQITRWHFIVRNRSVGSDLDLMRSDEPIGKAELVARLGDDGEVLDGPRDYRARLRELLFGFASDEQYQTMLRLMLDLRRPHLSKTLDPDGVARQLSAGLPQIDESLMRRLAGGLEQIETLEHGLTRLRDVRERARRFHQRTYAAYTRAVVRERADAVRQSQTAVESAAEVVREVTALLEATRQEAHDAVTRRDRADADTARLSAEERAIISSASWSSVAEVEALRGGVEAQRAAARAARDHADDAASAASEVEAELITARAAAVEEHTRAENELSRALTLAEHAGLTRENRLAADRLRDGTVPPKTWGEMARGVAGDWRDVLHRHRGLLREAERASEEASRAREHERERAVRVEETASRRAACEEQLEELRAAVTAIFVDWREALVELSVDDESADAALELVYAGRDPSPALVTHVDRARTALADIRSSLATSGRLAGEAIERAELEVGQLADLREEGPRGPVWARSDRAVRAGAPLWRLVDFQAGVAANERAGLEGALEASGLLDAWITPSGTIEDPVLADVVLVGGGPVGGDTLAGALVPVDDGAVASDAVARLLGTIGLGARDSGPWVDLAGRFALGPLAGRGAKPEAEHVGAAAREARRARRTAELREEIAQLEGEIAAIEAEIAGIDLRRAMLDGELAGLPTSEAIPAAIDATRVLSHQEAQASREHDRAVAQAREAADAEVAADAARREHAAGHGLPPRVDEQVLDRMRQASAELGGIVSAVSHAWTQAASQAEAASGLAARLTSASAAAQERGRGARDQEAEAERLEAEHAAREDALGSTGEELRRRHAEIGVELRDGRAAAREAAAVAQDALVKAAGLERDVTSATGEHERSRAGREQACADFSNLGGVGILGLVLGEQIPADVERAATWTVTRALDVARALPAELLSVRSSSAELAVEVQRAIQLLDRELAEADMGAYISRGADGLQLVTITEGGGEQTLSEALDGLEAEIADREQILTAEERRVFNDALVEEIADHLRQRIHEVRGRVDQMNRVLGRSPTAAGRIVELDWQPLDGDEGTQRTALALVRRDVRRVQGEAREELVAFFRGQIERARRDHQAGQAPRPMGDMLMDAFDYRGWFAFGLYERGEAGRVRLTKRRHAVGSGGEQSVLIHLPLFAAAAALYGDASAPRLIMLDEALSGIDDETRERVLAATVAFDLDVVMTSHELWGTYRSVPQLSIYQLHRENGTFGVHAIPFLWDGDVLRELEQTELLL
ncbi:MAG: hypothetical protein QOH12_180 [Solirubrobacteraceae bacterium]|jgi:uncharacterized protein (TIGR02680 family)|nr:hypothetical protein [Solirubrobacteraceae bacterium]